MFFHHHCDTSNGSQIPHKDLQENWTKPHF
jgi:hypothetical protein